MITISGLTKSYGSQVLFDDVSFKLNPREKIGVVGRNGHGKSTLFRLISGEEDYDAGTISIPKDYTYGWLKQQINFTEKTVLKEGVKGLSEHDKLETWKVEKILFGLGFSSEDLEKNPEDLSGGFQIRLNLAQTLLQNPDLLLLDEPNNFLDITSIRWLSKFLIDWQGELLLITHDRGFMDAVVTHTLGMHRKKFRKIQGNTGKLYSKIAQEEEIHEKTRINDERKRKDTEIFITRFRAKARLAGMVQSRVKALAKQDRKDKLEKIKDLDFEFKSKPFQGKYILSADNLKFGFDEEKPLFQNLSFTVKAGDRLFIIGKNGKGKTTLLKVIAGVLKESTGKINFHPAVEKGAYLESNLPKLSSSRTVLEEIQGANAKMDSQTARNICGLMMFEQDDALKKIEMLSGGEKSRVMFGQLLTSPVNLLLLDEPTNHFDLQSCDALLAAMDNFDGAIIMVTHNEMILNLLAERLIIFENENATVFEGSYDDFLRKKGWQDEDSIKGKNSQDSDSQNEKINKKDLRKLRSQIIGDRSKQLKPLESKVKALEKDIYKQELLEKNINEEIILASVNQEGEKIKSLSQKLNQCQAKIDRLYTDLEKHTTEFETLNAQFEKELSEIG